MNNDTVPKKVMALEVYNHLKDKKTLSIILCVLPFIQMLTSKINFLTQGIIVIISCVYGAYILNNTKKEMERLEEKYLYKEIKIPKNE